MKTTETQEATGRNWRVEEKCRAVLAVWTERKKGSDICREMSISGALLNQWQERAMEGLLEALEPRGPRQSAGGSALGNKVRKLLERKSRELDLTVIVRGGKPEMPKLERKLQRMLEEKHQAAS